YISDRAVRDSTEDEQVQVAQLRRAYAGRHPGMWRRCGDSVNSSELWYSRSEYVVTTRVERGSLVVEVMVLVEVVVDVSVEGVARRRILLGFARTAVATGTKRGRPRSRARLVSV